MKTIEVRLNGTDKNPWHEYGHTQNPFPQIAEYGKYAHIMNLQKLGGDPIPDTDYIRRTLQGWSEEFIEKCCSMFEKGKMVKFTVSYEE